MVEPRRDLDLAQKPLRSQRLRQLRPEKRECHSSIVSDVVGEVDGRHATTSNLVLYAVSPPQCHAKSGGINHRPLLDGRTPTNFERHATYARWSSTLQSWT